MENDLMSIWNKLKSVPKSALTLITGGRLKGMSDIKPQWRLEKLTETFGPCGIGWKYVIVEKWATLIEPLDELLCFVEINLYHRELGEKNKDAVAIWSDPIPAIGGNYLCVKEKKGLHTSDDGYKMALTDAIGVAGKALGLASDVYMGHGGKYAPKSTPVEPDEKPIPFLEKQNQLKELLIKLNDGDKEGASNQLHVLTKGKHDRVTNLTTEEAQELITLLER